MRGENDGVLDTRRPTSCHETVLTSEIDAPIFARCASSRPTFPTTGGIPSVCTCEGENLSPANHGVGIDAPPATRSFVLPFGSHPDAPDGRWRHWAAYDIPHGWKVRRLARGRGRPKWARATRRQAINDFGRAVYGGPCLPRGDGARTARTASTAWRSSVEQAQRPRRPSALQRRRARRGAQACREAWLVGLFEPAYVVLDACRRKGRPCGRPLRTSGAASKPLPPGEP